MKGDAVFDDSEFEDLVPMVRTAPQLAEVVARRSEPAKTGGYAKSRITLRGAALEFMASHEYCNIRVGGASENVLLILPDKMGRYKLANGKGMWLPLWFVSSWPNDGRDAATCVWEIVQTKSGRALKITIPEEFCRPLTANERAKAQVAVEARAQAREAIPALVSSMPPPTSKFIVGPEVDVLTKAILGLSITQRQLVAAVAKAGVLSDARAAVAIYGEDFAQHPLDATKTLLVHLNRMKGALKQAGAAMDYAKGRGFYFEPDALPLVRSALMGAK